MAKLYAKLCRQINNSTVHHQRILLLAQPCHMLRKNVEKHNLTFNFPDIIYKYDKCMTLCQIIIYFF